MKKEIYILAIAFILGLAVVSAEWPLDKTATCSLLNQTGAVCDATWCGIIDCSYNASKSACICTQIVYVNQTLNVTPNTTITASLDLSAFYNKSEVNNLIENTSSQLRGESLNQTVQLRDSLANRLDNESIRLNQRVDGLDKSQATQSSFQPWMIVAVVAVVMASICYLAWTSSKSKQKQREGSPIHQFIQIAGKSAEEQRKEKAKKIAAEARQIEATKSNKKVKEEEDPEE